VTKTWQDYIETEQLPEDYQIMADAIGLENTIRLAQALSGISIYLVKPEKLFKPFKIKYVLDCYRHACPEQPFNHRRLALETGLSVREVYTIIEKGKKVEI